MPRGIIYEALKFGDKGCFSSRYIRVIFIQIANGRNMSFPFIKKEARI